MGYTKLFSEIVGSTIWDEKPYVKIVWITMLAMKDERHEVMSSVPGLAHLARVSIQECEEALKAFLSPDHHSRSKEFEGRRIETCEGGWHILNGEKYRQKRSEEERREYMRTYMKKYRESSLTVNNPVNKSKLTLTNVSCVSPTEQNRTEYIYYEKKEEPKSSSNVLNPPSLKKDPQLFAKESFEAFWKIYPKKRIGDEMKALAVWDFKRYPPEQVTQIIKAVQIQLEDPDWIKKGGKYVPRADKYLAEDQWKIHFPVRSVVRTVFLED